MDETLYSYYLFGLETLQGRLPALAGEAAGVRTAEDIEYVHRMRVASRRMRNALALFGDDLPRKHYAAWRGEMRRITRALGGARDADVQIAWVQDFLKQDTDERSGWASSACCSGCASSGRACRRFQQRRPAHTCEPDPHNSEPKGSLSRSPHPLSSYRHLMRDGGNRTQRKALNSGFRTQSISLSLRLCVFARSLLCSILTRRIGLSLRTLRLGEKTALLLAYQPFFALFAGAAVFYEGGSLCLG